MKHTVVRLSIGQTLVVIAGLFIATMLGILSYTVLTIRNQRSMAAEINIAGRQRMLNQMFMKEVFLASQGHRVNYRDTAELWKGSLNALIHGGRVALLGQTETVELPPASDEAIRKKLIEQQRLIEEFVRKGERFAQRPEGSPGSAVELQELLGLNETLNEVTVEAARLFYAKADAEVANMLAWEISLSLCAAGLGLLLTVQVVRASRELVEEIAQRQHAEEELRRSEAQRIEAFRQSDELKSALLSLISHELRTPLTAIKTSVVSLQGVEGGLPEDTRVELLRGIDEEVDYLDRLISNLLDMSRIEAGQLVPNRGWYPIEDLVEGALRRSATMLQARRVDIQLPDGLAPVHVDAVEIQQVLVNLLDNAAKYSFPGTAIRLTARQTDSELTISVSNEGEGIAENDLDRVFDRFYRVRSKRERPVRGSGLGLAICKGIIAAHGGRIWVESTLGHVTTVTFTLPVREPAPSFLDLPTC